MKKRKYDHLLLVIHLATLNACYKQTPWRQKQPGLRGLCAGLCIFLLGGKRRVST